MYKLTKEFLESQIKDVQYIETVPGRCVHCVITVKNGYVFQGDAGVIDPENFDFEIGKKVAYDNTFDKMWNVYGYQVQEKYYREKVLTLEDNVKIEINELETKLEKLAKVCSHLSSDELLQKQFELLKAYKHVLEQRLKNF